MTCFTLYNCCDCGGKEDDTCGCRYCFSCNACENCRKDNDDKNCQNKED